MATLGRTIVSETEIKKHKHWVIFNPKGDTPVRIHKTYESAEAEARRLAEKHRGDDFIVYEAVASACNQTLVKKIEHRWVSIGGQ